MGHGRFSSLADGAVHVLGKFQSFGQIDKPLHGDGIICFLRFFAENTLDKSRLKESI